MMKIGRRKVILCSFHSLIGKSFTTGIVETNFGGMRNNDILIRILRASIFIITWSLRIRAGKHLLYRPDDIWGKRICVPR